MVLYLFAELNRFLNMYIYVFVYFLHTYSPFKIYYIFYVEYLSCRQYWGNVLECL